MLDGVLILNASMSDNFAFVQFSFFCCDNCEALLREW